MNAKKLLQWYRYFIVRHRMEPKYARSHALSWTAGSGEILYAHLNKYNQYWRTR